MTLKDLEIGDKFYPASKISKKTNIFQVIGAVTFNPRHGRPTRMCVDLFKQIQVSKSCSLNVIKTTSFRTK